MNWVIASLLMFASSVALYVLVRKATLLKIPTELLNLASFIVPLFLYIFLAFENKANIVMKPYPFFIIFLLSIVGSYLPNVTSLNSIKLAPNIGYVNAINASSISAVTLFSALLFKDEFSIKKFVGVIGVTAGLILLIL